MFTFFILGSHPDLAKAEIFSVVGSSCKVVLESPAVLMLSGVTQSHIDLQERLGGTIKIGTVMEEFQGGDPRACTELIIETAKKAEGKNKLTFGLSAYDMGGKKTVSRIVSSYRVMGGEIKNGLKETGRPVRFVQAKGEALTSVVVETNGLCESAGEFCFFATDSSIILGRTDTVQNFKAWSDRDFGRPARDSRSGMLPPKLARMMINLTAVNPSTSTLLDPFCGSGTIPMEAALMGFQHILGSDISDKAIRDSRTNTQWVYEQKFLQPKTEQSNIEFRVSKAEDVRMWLSESVDAIAAETYLGPANHGFDKGTLNALTNDLMDIFEPALKSLSQKLKPSGTMILAFPAFVTNAGLVKLPLTHAIADAGLTIDGSWIYKREDQRTAREIIRMKKK